jgi:hypothetical protein
MGTIGPRCALLGVIVGLVALASVARAGSNGFGLVPGARIGVVRGSFDGSETMPGAQSGWGRSTEVHVDGLRTFSRDRRAIGLSLSVLSLKHGDFDSSVPSAADAFEHSGIGLSLMLSTVVGRMNVLTVRAGLVDGETNTGAGEIDGALKRFGVQATRIFKAASFLHVAGHVAIDYFTKGNGTRGYDAFSIVVGGTFVFVRE